MNKSTEDQQPEEVYFQELIETDPYLASALEFMYSEDTEDDFNEMDQEQQEAYLKKTWIDREKEFYGEEDNYKFNHTITEQIENEDEDSDDDDDDMLTRNE